MSLVHFEKIISLVFLLQFSLFAQTQGTQDSLNQKVVRESKEKFPEASIINVEISHTLNRQFTSKYEDINLNKGELISQRNYSLSTFIPFYIKGGLEFNTTFSYQLNQFEFQNIENTFTFATPPVLFEQNGTLDFHYLSTELNASYFKYLFDKIPVAFNASILADASNTRLGRIKGSIGITLLLKGTERTLIGIGLVGYIDPSAQIPALPVFLYKHKFKNPKWEFIALLPRKVFLRKLIGENGRLSLGGTLGSPVFYVNSNDQLLGDLFEYNQLEIKAGILYEHRFNDFVIGRLQVGKHIIFNSILVEKGALVNDYFYENKPDAALYFRIGLSINPFAKNNTN